MTPREPGPCPLCGGQVERVRAQDGGAIERLVWTAPHGRICRVTRPASFYACARCEWCSETAP
jgi:hypothetical protein